MSIKTLFLLRVDVEFYLNYQLSYIDKWNDEGRNEEEGGLGNSFLFLRTHIFKYRIIIDIGLSSVFVDVPQRQGKQKEK